MNRVEIHKELSIIATDISNCRLCSLCLNRNKTVPGSGKGRIPPNIMFVGEGPGEVEDTIGKPFMGETGQILRSAIAYWEFENYFITNIVKCRPPGNRNPKTEEVDACIGYLKEQIKVLQPKLIVVVGRQAQKAFERHNIKYDHFAYHPSYYKRTGKSLVYHEEYIGFIEKYREIDPEWIPF